jgi:hypothetical protein
VSPILEIEVRGKRGIDFCKSMPGARVYERLLNRAKPSSSRRQPEVGAPIMVEIPMPTDHMFATPSHGENMGSSPLGSASDFNRLAQTSAVVSNGRPINTSGRL